MTGTRFSKGQSGNPNGRPRKVRPNVSAFDVIFDRTLTVTQNGLERELTVDEGLQLQTYQAALKGSRMAIRHVLRMIEKREAALAKLDPPKPGPGKMEIEHDADNANAAMLILGIAAHGEAPSGGGPAMRPLRIATWAAQAAISRRGRRHLDARAVEDIERLVANPGKLRWPRGRGQ